MEIETAEAWTVAGRCLDQFGRRVAEELADGRTDHWVGTQQALRFVVDAIDQTFSSLNEFVGYRVNDEARAANDAVQAALRATFPILDDRTPAGTGPSA